MLLFIIGDYVSCISHGYCRRCCPCISPPLEDDEINHVQNQDHQHVTDHTPDESVVANKLVKTPVKASAVAGGGASNKIAARTS